MVATFEPFLRGIAEGGVMKRDAFARWTAAVVLGVSVVGAGGTALADKPARGCGTDFRLVDRAAAFAILEEDFPNGSDEAKNEFLDSVDKNADAWFCVKRTPSISNFVDNTSNH